MSQIVLACVEQSGSSQRLHCLLLGYVSYSTLSLWSQFSVASSRHTSFTAFTSFEVFCCSSSLIFLRDRDLSYDYVVWKLLHASKSIHTTVVDKHHCSGIFWALLWHYSVLCLMWWFIMLTAVVFFAYCGEYALLWWVIMLYRLVYYACSCGIFLRTVVNTQHCGGLLCFIGWFTMLAVVVFFAYCGE